MRDVCVRLLFDKEIITRDVSVVRQHFPFCFVAEQTEEEGETRLMMHVNIIFLVLEDFSTGCYVQVERMSVSTIRFRSRCNN